MNHGVCPTCGRCRCCGQYAYTFSYDDTVKSGQLDQVDKFMELIKGVRCDSSFPIDRKMVEDIINE